MQSQKSHDRNNEIVFFFYLIYGNRIHSGMKNDEARKEAYDAVQLRYGISQGRLLNIISQQRGVRNVRTEAFIVKAHALIDELVTVNGELEDVREKNDKLIALLEECVNAVKI